MNGGGVRSPALSSFIPILRKPEKTAREMRAVMESAAAQQNAKIARVKTVQPTPPPRR